MSKQPKDEGLYLRHISECLTRIAVYIGEGREQFSTDTKTQDAVLRNLQTMAESTQRLSSETKAAHPTVDWKAISGLRNVLAHDYLDVDTDQVWDIVTFDLPPLAQKIAVMLRESSADKP